MTETPPGDDPGLQEMIIDLVKKARDNWLEANGRDVDEVVRKTLDHARQELIGGLLGFSNRFGKWEVDSRSPSDLVKNLREQIDPRVQAIVTEMLAEWKTTDEMVEAARKEFKQSFKFHLRQAAQAAGRNEAERFVGEVITKLTGHPVFVPKNLDDDQAF